MIPPRRYGDPDRVLSSFLYLLVDELQEDVAGLEAVLVERAGHEPYRTGAETVYRGGGPVVLNSSSFMGVPAPGKLATGETRSRGGGVGAFVWFTD